MTFFFPTASEYCADLDSSVITSAVQDYFDTTPNKERQNIEESVVASHPEQAEEIRSLFRMFERLCDTETKCQLGLYYWDIPHIQTQRVFLFDKQTNCLILLNQQPDRQAFIHGLENIRRYLEDFATFPLPEVTEEHKAICNEHNEQMRREYDAQERMQTMH